MCHLRCTIQAHTYLQYKHFLRLQAPMLMTCSSHQSQFKIYLRRQMQNTETAVSNTRHMMTTACHVFCSPDPGQAQTMQSRNARTSVSLPRCRKTVSIALPVLSSLSVAPPLRSLSINQCFPRIPSFPCNSIQDHLVSRAHPITQTCA